MKDLNWRLVLLGIVICAIAAAASPYVTLKLGQSIDLTMGGMFLAAYALRRRASGRDLAIQLNIIQTMIGIVTGITFMVVILAAFYYIQTVFKRDIGFNPTPWQMFFWLLVSANLGVFMGIVPRSSILKDRSLPWPSSKATLSVAETLSDPSATQVTAMRRNVLAVSTGVSGFLVFLRDGLSVIPPMVGNAALSITFGLELAAIGLGMLTPLAVGLSGLLGTWIVYSFGETAARYSSLSGVADDKIVACLASIDKFSGLSGVDKSSTLEFLGANCGKAAEYVQSASHFKFLVQWMMWPATALMISAALTSSILPFVINLWSRKKLQQSEAQQPSLADEHIPGWWTVLGIVVSVVPLVWLTSSWFGMSWVEVALAIAIQPLLIVAGLRVLGITGSGPVSLMANATQFLFGLLWPAQVKSNLSAAYISANPQSASENVVPSFWVAQRLGGRFKTLILAQLIVIPVGALLTPIMFSVMERTYGIGLEPGQLAAPTGLKIATLAMVMEQGLGYLPKGALNASIAAIFIGILFELLLAIRKKDAEGNDVSVLWFIPIPAALGFALILPASLNIAFAVGCVISAVWHKFSPDKKGSYELFAAPLASGLVAGEAMVGSILMPALLALVDFLQGLL